MSSEMSNLSRRPRADAERNRRSLLDAAAAVFGERGLDVGVAEIAQRAGVGRGTLFRNFPTKQDLIAAIVVDQMNAAAARGRELLDAPDAGEALFEFLDEIAGRQQQSRPLFEAVQDTFLANREIRESHAAIVEMLDALLARAQDAGAVRPDIRALDVLLLLKGVCETATAFQQVDPQISERHLDLVQAALAPPATAHMLRGRSPTLDDIERAFASGEPAPDADSTRATA
jgi:AcrR family transcriptional regulator